MNKLSKWIYRFFIIIVLFFAVMAAYILTWNQSFNHKLLALKHLKMALIDIKPQPVDLSNNLKVVYVSGHVGSKDKLFDEQTGLSFDAITASRRIYVYQWQEHHNKLMNNKNDYQYEKKWTEQLNDSSVFKIKM